MYWGGHGDGGPSQVDTVMKAPSCSNVDIVMEAPLCTNVDTVMKAPVMWTQ